jgi:hypothetical protein
MAQARQALNGGGGIDDEMAELEAMDDEDTSWQSNPAMILEINTVPPGGGGGGGKPRTKSSSSSSSSCIVPGGNSSAAAGSLALATEMTAVEEAHAIDAIFLSPHKTEVLHALDQASPHVQGLHELWHRARVGDEQMNTADAETTDETKLSHSRPILAIDAVVDPHTGFVVDIAELTNVSGSDAMLFLQSSTVPDQIEFLTFALTPGQMGQFSAIASSFYALHREPNDPHGLHRFECGSLIVLLACALEDAHLDHTASILRLLWVLSRNQENARLMLGQAGAVGVAVRRLGRAPSAKHKDQDTLLHVCLLTLLCGVVWGARK